jgi:streptogramin lyase
MTVTPGPLGRFDVVTPSSYTAGGTGLTTVTARDSFGNLLTGYAGSPTGTTTMHAVTFGCTGACTPFAQVGTFTNGTATLTFRGYLAEPGRTLTVTAGAVSGTSGPFTVVAGLADNFLLSGLPSTATAGDVLSFTVTARDRYGNTATGYRGTASFGGGGLNATMPSPYTFTGADNGSHLFTGVVLRTIGTHVMSATDTVLPTITATSTVHVSPAALYTVLVGGPDNPWVAGSAKTINVVATDVYNNVVPSYRGTVTFTSTDAAADLPANYTFVAGDNGIHQFVGGVTLRTAGTQQVRATDLSDSTVTSAREVTVVPAALTHVVLSPSTATIPAGGSQAYTAEGFDAYNNSRGDVTASSVFDVDGNTTACSAAVCSATASGSHTVHAVTDAVTGTAGLTVLPGVLASFGIATPGPYTAGTLGTTTVTAYDANGNVLTDYAGSPTGTTTLHAVTFGCTAACTPFAQVGTFTNGTATLTFRGYLAETGRTLTVTAGAVSGTSAPFEVSPAAAKDFALTGLPSTATAGDALSFTVTARDQYRNTATGYLGTATLGGGGPNATMPSSYTFTAADNGAHTFTGVVLRIRGTHVMSATDTVVSTITGTSTIQVSPAALSSFAVAGLADPSTAGPAQTLVVVARDAYNNAVSSYVGTVAFSSTDGAADLPATYTFVAGDQGIHQFMGGVTLRTAGPRHVSATDIGNPTITGASLVTVVPAALTHLVLSPSSATMTSGGSQAYTAEGFDAYNNSRGDVTASTSFSIGPDGSCAAASCTASLPGGHTVIGNNGGSTGTANVIVIAPAPGCVTSSSTWTFFTCPAPDSELYAMTQGPDGAMWFTEQSANKIGRIAPDGSVTEFDVPSINGDNPTPTAITTGPDGALWFTEYVGGNNNGAIGKMTTDGVYTQYQLPNYNSIPQGITVGPDGNVWFTEADPVNGIGRLTPSGTLTEFPLGSPSNANSIVAGPDGNLWFTEWDTMRVGRMSPTGAVTRYDVSAAGEHTNYITLGPDGALWFIGDAGVGRITTSGVVTTFAADASLLPFTGLTAGHDGALWLTSLYANKVTRITTAGVYTASVLSPTGSGGPFGIATADDGAIWFGQLHGSAISRITP